MRGGDLSPGACRKGGLRLLVAALFLLASCSSFFRTSVPQREGTLAVPGLLGPVEIVRDAYGIPHITAENDHDLYFAQGFVHAQDRLFQMDMERRVARGELAEIYGEKALYADRLFRHLGFSARAPGLFASLPEESKAIVRSYCEGVNAAMESLGAWPVEHRLLRFAPREFTPEDVAAIGLLKSFGLAQWGDEVALFQAREKLPGEKADELMPRVIPDSPVIAPGFVASMPSGLSPSVLSEGLASLRRSVGALPRAGGSNAWAVSGEKSATGLPILANDPHILLPSPSLWYEIHLVAPGVDVYGVSFPGAPCVVIGHNPDIAWGFTNAMLDDADFFIEKMDGEQVMFRGKWIPMRKRLEKIRVRGKGEETLPVWETPHGPVLSPVLSGVSAALSLRWVGFDGGDAPGVLHALNRARNRKEFVDAVSGFPHPAQNIVYAEIFFDPQTHLFRGIPFCSIVDGINRACLDARDTLGIDTKLIMCFLRHLSEEGAFDTLIESLPYKDLIYGVGLDSSEVGNPPEKFKRVFAKAEQEGFALVAHAGEEGGPEYIWGALEHLKAERIDHGVRCDEDDDLVRTLIENDIPLTVCPLSNVRLRVFDNLEDHNLKTLLRRGVNVSVHSDDPAYFGGYLCENLIACHKALDLGKQDIINLVQNSFKSAFIDGHTRDFYIDWLDNVINAHREVF